MKLFDFILVRFVIFLALGIIIGSYQLMTIQVTLSILCTLIIALSILIRLSKVQFKRRIWFGILTYTTIIILGILSVNFHKQSNFKNHYTQHHTILSDVVLLQFRIQKTLKSNAYNDKYLVEIFRINDLPSRGKILLNIKKDSSNSNLQIDDIYTSKTEIRTIKQPLNPYQFNYSSYLKKQYVYHQIFSERQSLNKIHSNKYSINGVANLFRTAVISKLSLHNFKQDELAIINALLLGQRQDISDETYANFTDAGVIHILAVSGLHVGIVLLLLNFIFRPLERLWYGKQIKIVVILICLWGFAFVAGLSASVTRAVTMFSVVAIAMNLNRPTNIYNTLAISAFILLLYKPMFLFDVGFQLSYFAVIGIVSLQPIIYKLWQPSFLIVDKLWQVFTVSLAAQIGVLPLSLYYFHQFPGLFMVSNLVVIPVLGALLGIGILVIVLALLNLLPSFLVDFYSSFIQYLQGFISWVSNFEKFIITDISFSMSFVIASYILIIAFTQYFKNGSNRHFKIVLCSIITLQGVCLFHKFEINQQNELVIFNKTRHTIIGETRKNNLYLFSDLDSTSNDYIISNYTIGNSIIRKTTNPIAPLYSLKNEKLLVIDSLAIFEFKSIKPDYILLTQSPKLNLNRLIDSIQPKAIISDGSNYKSYEKRWEETCRKRKLPFHQTRKKGAYIIKL